MAKRRKVRPDEPTGKPKEKQTMKSKKTIQYELPGAQDAFNLSGECQDTIPTPKVAPSEPQEAGRLFPEVPQTPAWQREVAFRQALGRLPGQGINPDGFTFDGEASFEEGRI